MDPEVGGSSPPNRTITSMNEVDWLSGGPASATRHFIWHGVKQKARRRFHRRAFVGICDASDHEPWRATRAMSARVMPMSLSSRLDRRLSSFMVVRMRRQLR